jgi:exosome complex component RRP40
MSPLFGAPTVFSLLQYVVVKGERVLGVVTKTGRVHRVDIGAAHLASLPELAFQGATRRNKPALQVGELVYAVVSRAHPHLEPEISCMDGGGKSDGLGPIPTSGFMIRCSLGLCRKLLAEPSPVLKALGARLKYECVVGVNGRVWVKAADVAQTIIVVNAVRNSEYMSEEQCRQMVEQMLEL